MLELISTVADGIQIVSALTDDQKSAHPKLDRLDDSVVEALRQIYFTPQGVLALLKRLAQGERLEPSEVEIVLPRFNDSEWRVSRALHMLEFEGLAENREISLNRARVLDQLRFGKINLRRDIQKALNKPLTYGEQPPKDVAIDLLARVSALNEQIEALEEAHNYRTRR